MEGISLFERFIAAVRNFDWASATILFTTITTITAAVEKLFGIKFVGRYIIGFITRPFRAAVENRKMLNTVLQQLGALTETQAQQTKTIGEISAEVRMNGGKYLMRDAIAAMALNQKEITGMIDATFQASPIPSYIMDGKGMLLNVNMAWLKMTGAVSVDEVKGMGWLKFIPFEERESLRQQSLLERDVPSDYNGPVTFWNPCTQVRISTMVRSRVVRDDHGEATHQIGSIDIIDETPIK